MKALTIIILLISFAWINIQSADLILYGKPNKTINKDYSVLINGKPLPLQTASTRYGNNATFGYLDFSDSIDITITTKNPAPHTTNWLILPLKDSVKYKMVKNGVINFKLHKPSNLTFVVNGDYRGRVLHLFADTLQTTIPKKDSPGLIYFEPGYHEINPGNNNILNLESNQSVYIAGGAIVKGCIHASNAENIKIYGRGILMQDTTMTRARGVDIESCDNVIIEGIIINRNRDNWSGFIYKSDNIIVDGVKVISPAIWSTDGMNLANCKNAVIKNSFFRAGDDNIAIKGLGNHRNHSTAVINPSDALPNENITISNCTFWSDNNNAVVLGQETIAEYYKNITFSDCEVLFVRDEEPIKAALAVISLHATDMSEISFNNFLVGSSGQLITIFNTNEIFRIKGSQHWAGTIHDITFNNIRTYGRGNKNIRIYGWDQNKTIDNITFNNIIVNNDTLSKESAFFDINTYTNNIIVNGDTIKKAGIDSTGFEVIKK